MRYPVLRIRDLGKTDTWRKHSLMHKHLQIKHEHTKHCNVFIFTVYIQEAWEKGKDNFDVPLTNLKYYIPRHYTFKIYFSGTKQSLQRWSNYHHELLETVRQIKATEAKVIYSCVRKTQWSQNNFTRRQSNWLCKILISRSWNHSEAWWTSWIYILIFLVKYLLVCTKEGDKLSWKSLGFSI